MIKSWLFTLKKKLPQTLFGRALIIVIAPVVLVQMTTTYVFIDRHWSKVTQLLADDIAGSICGCMDLIRQSPELLTLPFVKNYAARNFNFKIHLLPLENKIQGMNGSAINSWHQHILYTSLDKHLSMPFAIRLDDQNILIHVAHHSQVISFSMPLKKLFTRTTPLFLWWALLTPLLFLMVAVIFLNNQLKPLRHLSAIVDEFGKGRDVKVLLPKGALEVRVVARAFNAMKARIHRQMTHRSEMLAGVSHDLKTPLTRMELTLAMLQEKNLAAFEISELQEDVREMSQMVQGYLDFAKGEEKEAPQLVDITQMIVRLQHKLGRSYIHIQDAPPIHVMIKANAMQRCLTNILSNALRYATHAYVSLYQGHKALKIIIEDDGPGIPDTYLDTVFRPFYRIESSRNPETGGTGLGLTIARTLMNSHGGDIKLARSELHNGLQVTLNLPT